MSRPTDDRFGIFDRENRIAQLARLLIADGDGALVNLHGAPGSGKTSFARLFLERHHDAFPGGTVHLNVHGDLRDHWPAISDLRADAPSLVVLDDFDHAWVTSISSGLDVIRRERPRARILTISNGAITSPSTTGDVEMPPLPVTRVIQLLSRDGHVEPARLRRLARLLEGNAAATAEASKRLASGISAEQLIAWIERVEIPFARDPDGKPLPFGAPGRTALELAVTEISDTLIAELAANPKRLYQLDPRKFEQLVAELYRRKGFEATLTPASGDEGVDVYVVRNDDMGRTLWVVQAKRYAAHRRIGGGVVRELYGTVEAKNASAGILVTTSFFEPAAERQVTDLEYRLNLRDYFGLQDMLRW